MRHDGSFSGGGRRTLDRPGKERLPRVLLVNAISESDLNEQDGAPPHYHKRAYLDTVAPGHWIGGKGSNEYFSRSPDLTLLGNPQERGVYSKKSRTLDERYYETET
ncbi:hypothetical protein TNCV_316911 [Trichonephila clavipes]|nr:hypothetical protein TNCV_316911 [Trichonephila clavipes]